MRSIANNPHRFKFRYLHIVFGLIMFSLGITASLLVNRVTAQNGNEIHACVTQQSGSVRIVAAGESCHPSESSLTWAIQGPAGPSGPPGPSGTGTGLPFFCYNCYLTPFADKFKGRDFSGSQLYSTIFTGADISGVNFKGGFFLSVDFKNANLTGADFSELIHDVPSWYRASSGVSLQNSNLTNANFSNTKIDTFYFDNATLQNANFSNTTIINSDFPGAQQMSTANVTGTVWDDVTCPDGTNSNNNGNTCVGHF